MKKRESGDTYINVSFTSKGQGAKRRSLIDDDDDEQQQTTTTTGGENVDD